MSTPNNEIVIFIIGTTFLILLLAGFIVTILSLYQKRQISFQKNIEDIKLKHEKNILQTQLEIQEQTFQDVSRDIHDNISLSLTLSKLHLNTIDFADPETFYEKVNFSISLIGEAIQNLSNISKSLNADIIKHNGLLKAIENEVIIIGKLGLYNIEYEIIGTPVFLECQKELILFRIIQECFNNIIKHAKAKKVVLLLNYSSTHLELLIEDDGIGFITTQTEHEKYLKTSAGLNNIKERTKMLNGECIIDSMINRGTAVKIYVPF